MARYFFHVFANDTVSRDDDGTEFDDPEHVRQEAMRALPEIARDEVPRDGDRQSFTVLVTDDAGRPVYTATLGFAGLWLDQISN